MTVTLSKVDHLLCPVALYNAKICLQSLPADVTDQPSLSRHCRADSCFYASIHRPDQLRLSKGGQSVMYNDVSKQLQFPLSISPCSASANTVASTDINCWSCPVTRGWLEAACERRQWHPSRDVFRTSSFLNVFRAARGRHFGFPSWFVSNLVVVEVVLWIELSVLFP